MTRHTLTLRRHTLTLRRHTLTWRIEWKVADCWVGAFWKRSPGWLSQTDRLDIWICVIPCLPLHLTRLTITELP